MAVELVRGANTSLGGANRVAVRLSWPATAAGVELDPSAFLVATGGKVRSDDDFIFYNQPKSADGSVLLLADPVQTGDRLERVVEIDLDRVPAGIDKIVLAVTIYLAKPRRQTFGQVGQLGARILNGTVEICSFTFTADAGSETAMIFGEVYRRNAEWKFRAVGQGHGDGLAALATGLGVEVEPEAEPLPPPNANVAPFPVSAPPPVISAPAAGPRSSMIQRGQHAGITIDGLRGELLIVLPRPTAELGCLYELTDGAKGYLGPLGNRWGDYHQKPHIRYFATAFGDDPASGEAIVINGGKISRVAKMLIFATLDGSDRQLTISATGSRPVEVPASGSGLTAIVSIEISPPAIDITYLGVSFVTHQALDDQYRWGLRWPSPAGR